MCGVILVPHSPSPNVGYTLEYGRDLSFKLSRQAVSILKVVQFICGVIPKAETTVLLCRDREGCSVNMAIWGYYR